jgi:hypothetical protein
MLQEEFNSGGPFFFWNENIPQEIGELTLILLGACGAHVWIFKYSACHQWWLGATLLNESRAK